MKPEGNCASEPASAFYIKTAAGWSGVGLTLGPVRFTGAKPDDAGNVVTTATVTGSFTMSRLSRAGLRWWRRQRQWAHNERTYRKPAAVKPAFRGRRHGW